jgi:hypothetical protein
MNIVRIARLVRPVIVGVMAIAALALALPSAAQQRSQAPYDHLRTRFPLTGAHAVTPCETCHIGGQMAGTPTQCDYCHRAGSRIAVTVKPARHVQTAESCDVCHRSSATWTGARFSHVAVTPGTCFSCHNGSTASGKPSGHVATTASCDSCHRTSAWLPAGFSHLTVTPGTCASCHNGSIATGKPSGHVVTTASCDQCHRTTAWVPASFNHASVAPGSCATCHRPGGSGLAKPANHIPYESQLLAGTSLGCDACHTSTTSFTVERMNHNNSQGNGAGWCRGCHLTGTSYLGNMQKKSLTHQQKTGVTDCSQSGCHRPLGTQGSTYRSWGG